MFFDTPITAVPLVKNGRLRALGVSTRTRSPLLPDVPTIEEAGVPGYEVLGWNGILVPSATPAPIVQKLNTELRAILAEPEVRSEARAAGRRARADGPGGFRRGLIRDDVAKWGGAHPRRHPARIGAIDAARQDHAQSRHALSRRELRRFLD